MVASRTKSMPGSARRSYEFIEGLAAQSCPHRRAALARLAVRADPGNPHAHAALGHEASDLDEATVSYVVAARLCETWPHRAPRSVTPAIRLALAAHGFLRHDPEGALAFLSGAGADAGGYLSDGFERLALASACAAGNAALLARLLDISGDRHVLLSPWLRLCLAHLRGEPTEHWRERAEREAPQILGAPRAVPANPAARLPCATPAEARVARACLAPGLSRVTGTD